MVNIKTSNECVVTNCPQSIIDIAKKTLSIKNPTYEKICRISGSRFAAQEYFRYYSIPKNTIGEIHFPRGFRTRFKRYLDKTKIEYHEEESFISNKSNEMDKWSPVILRDYQIPIVKQVVDGVAEGVIFAGVGSGKTVMSCELTRILKFKTTILCPTTIIMQQFIDEFKKWFDYDCAVFGDGKKEINKDVVVASWQSLSSDKQLANILYKRTGLLIIDESHGAISKERSRILHQFSPARMISLSGSPRRSRDDGRTDAIFFLLGEILAEHKLTQIIPSVEVVRSREVIPVSYNYHEMVDSMVNNDSRNTLIVGLTMMEILNGKKVLILTKRREHCQKLMDKLGNIKAYYADSDDKNRNETLMRMRNGEEDFCVLVGTVSLLATGLDIPSLDTVIFAGDIKSDVLIEQGAGRVLRLFEGKEESLIYDIFDNLNPIFKNQAYDRFKFYKNKGWEVKGLK